MTVLFAFLLLGLIAHNNMHKSKAAVPSCEQWNLNFAEVVLALVLWGWGSICATNCLFSSRSAALIKKIIYIYMHTPPPSNSSETDKEAHIKKK